MFEQLSQAQEDLISTLLGDAETFGCDPIDTVEAVAFLLRETGMDQRTAEMVACEAVGVVLH